MVVAHNLDLAVQALAVTVSLAGAALVEAVLKVEVVAALVVAVLLVVHVEEAAAVVVAESNQPSTHLNSLTKIQPK